MKASSIRTTAVTAATLCFALLAQHSYAGQMQMVKTSMEASENASSQALSTNEGEVKEVDRKNKTITLRHGHVKSKTVDMGPMTMNFPVRNAALLKHVKAGDKVKFTVESLNDVMMVTTLKVEK